VTQINQPPVHPECFRYTSENPVLGLLIGVPPLVFAFFSGPILRIILLSLSTGPLIWAVLQALRRWHKIKLDDTALTVQMSLSGRVVHVPWARVRGVVITHRGGLALAYTIPPKPSAVQQESGTERSLFGRFDDDEHDAANPPRAKQRLLHTAKVDDILNLVATIENYRSAQSTEELIPPEYMRRLAARRRLRDGCIALVALLATPLYVIILVRVIGSFR